MTKDKASSGGGWHAWAAEGGGGAGMAVGGHVGEIGGFGPVEEDDRPDLGVRVSWHVESPPQAFRDNARWYTVRFFPTRNYAGKVIPVVCFACGAVYLGGWVNRDVYLSQKDASPDPQGSAVLPRLDGTGTIKARNGRTYRCPCPVGAIRGPRGLDFASREIVQEALEDDLRLTREGARLLAENGGADGMTGKILEVADARMKAMEVPRASAPRGVEEIEESIPVEMREVVDAMFEVERVKDYLSTRPDEESRLRREGDIAMRALFEGDTEPITRLGEEIDRLVGKL